uniref:EGF-like domain-containing protein n=1 Tax=Globisporangium ultimum (strain ATCC 200006 / CBS 805.95 / DAOM BR144) TaxID=431595 RepID=K3WZS8_GLOUD
MRTRQTRTTVAFVAVLRAALLCCVLVAGRWLHAEGACPSKCHGHGTCNSSNNCDCFPGFTGFDCYKRQCPFATPWVDFSVAQDDMRSVSRECANRGTCNRGSGRCECDPGFTGAACNRLMVGCGSATNQCNGHGQCTSMKDIASLQNDYNLFYTTTYTTPWDAERIFGCVCDRGYSGVDCSLVLCPYGDDPITTNQVDEVQALSCLCNGCTGSFTLSFRGDTTRALDVGTETAATLKAALEEIATIRSVMVTLDGGASLCDNDGVSARITFTHEHGDVPALVIESKITGGTGHVAMQTGGAASAYGSQVATVRGTKEWTLCSGRGQCNTMTGQCTCDAGFESSDGLGGQGLIQDCGYRSGGAMTTCAGAAGTGIRCNGHGRCSGATEFKCQCEDGYFSHDCSKRNCPQGRAWFEEPQVNDVAHLTRVPCSNAGICNQMGRCDCVTGFEGVACERMSCPRNGDGVCSNRGVCRSARELAALTPTTSFTTAGFVYGSDPNLVATWDADMIQGCYCDKVHQHRGTEVRYTGYNCAKLPCPSGDDPWTSSQVDEVQTVSCAADGGRFTLSFRGETTRTIAASASPLAVETALERLRTVISVSVTFSTGITTACAAAGNVITITFHVPAGDLPPLTISSGSLTHSTATVSTGIAQLTQGSKEDAVCNNRGRCDEDTGTCICALHHASSNGQGGIGALDDCGAVDEFMTHGEL